MERLVSARNMVPCARCDGHGMAYLSDHLQMVVDLLEAHGPIATTDLLERMHAKGRRLNHTALCNRLVELERLGIATRTQDADDARIWKWDA